MIGVLALQGGYQRHLEAIQSLGQNATLVRSESDIKQCSALILPGGESTAMTWLLKREGLFDALRKAAERLPVFATCAGLILLGKGVRDPRVEQLELLDITVERNGYGAQVDSFEGRVQLADGGIIEGVFIRAPKIKAVGPSVTVLGTCEGEPVLVQQGNILAASFHPELGGDLLLHKMLLSLKLGHSQRF